MAALAVKDYRVQYHIWPFEIGQVRQAIRLQIGFWSLAIALAISWFWSTEEFRVRFRDRVFDLMISGACVVSVLLLLARCGHEEEAWYPIRALMTNPGSVPVFGHRLLWVWLADAVKMIHPNLTYRNAYLLSQVPPVLLTVWMVGRWSALYIEGQFKWAGQVLLVVILATTFDYFTFYDIAIVFFFSCCLLLLKKKRYAAFVAVLAIGTLNHENIVLLVPLAFLETYRNRRLCAIVCGSALAAHFGVRAILQAALPLEHQVTWHFWTNLYYPLVHPAILAGAWASVLFWWGAASTSWRSADVFLKQAALLLPMLLGVTFVFGQFEEARQFDALIPVVIAFILLRLASWQSQYAGVTAAGVTDHGVTSNG